MRGTLLPNPFFRPEEKHVASGENNIVPTTWPPEQGNEKASDTTVDRLNQSPD